MGFKVPNDPTALVNPATYVVQAQLDQGDFDVLVASHYGTGVLSGCAVTPTNSGVSMNVNVAAGVTVAQSAASTVTATNNVTIAAGGGNGTRIDLVVVGGLGVQVLPGTAAANPDYPTLTFDGNGNLTQVVLAAVTVPVNATSITPTNIIDKRVWRRLSTPQ